MPNEQKKDVTGRIFDGATLRKILEQVRPYRARFTLTGILVLVLSSLVWIRPALIRVAVDDAIPQGDAELLLRVFLGVVAMLVVEALLQFRVTYLANWVAQSVSLDLRSKLFRHIARCRSCSRCRRARGTSASHQSDQSHSLSRQYPNCGRTGHRHRRCHVCVCEK